MTYNDSKTKEKNRKKIVKVAKKLFILNGIGNTTIVDIVNSSRMERKTFYNYFKDKNEIATFINHQSLKTIYDDKSQYVNYDLCKNGFEKFENYLLSIARRYQNNIFDMLYITLYDNYYNNQPSNEMLNVIGSTSDSSAPIQYLIECGIDKSCKSNLENLHNLYSVIYQSIDSFARKIILDAYREKTLENDFPLDQLNILIGIHLRNISNEVYYNENT